jgi:DNA-binding LytR/AlgR family response regulator
MNIIICDDIPEALNTLEASVRACPIFREDEFRISRFSGGQEFLKAIKRGLKADFIFMDVRMPEISGIDAMHELPPSFDVPVVFVTSYAKYWPRIYSSFEAGYLAKPFDQEQFDDTVRAVLGRRDQIHPYMYTTNSRRQTIMCSRIRYFEVSGHAVTMYTTDAAIPLTNTKMSDIKAELEKYGFFLCNRAYLINLRFYYDRTDTDVLITSRNGEDRLQLSREKAKALDIAHIRYKTRGQYAF